MAEARRVPRAAGGAGPAPVRILFVLASLDTGPGETEARLLARHLDPGRYRIEVIACPRGEEMSGHAERQFAALGVPVDTTPRALSSDDRVAYLARRLTGFDLVLSFQTFPDILPALGRLALRPPLIERQAVGIPAMADPAGPGAAFGSDGAPGAVIPAWEALFGDVLAERPAAPPPRLFRSFLLGGWECSAHRRRDGRRLDVIAGTGHEANAEGDYRQLAGLGLRAMRDGLRWHLIERAPGRYDFASWRGMLEAAGAARVQVIWDLMHYGWPDDIDIWRPGFVDRFAAFAREAARLHRETTDAVPFWCPVNEISFHAWAGGDVAYLNPFATGRGFELKVQLARAAIAASRALREVDPRARLVQCEPLIAIHHDPATGHPRAEAEGWHDAQYQAAELIAGRIWPQIGGAPELLDILGANYYPRNQWIHGGPPVGPGHPLHRPLADLLFELHARFDRPLLIAETGTEGAARAPWLRMVLGETRGARARGVPVEGVCLYPVANHLGWDDDRLCENGLLGHAPLAGARGVYAPLRALLGDGAWRPVDEGSARTAWRN